MELIEPGMPTAPMHYEGGPYVMHRRTPPLDDDALLALVTKVRASVVRAASVELAKLSAALPEPIVSISLRAWPVDFPEDISIQRRVPYESRADSVMYRQVLAQLGRDRGWDVHLYNVRDVEAEAVRLLGPRADEILNRARSVLGPPWTKDHRMALAATMLLT
jgi:hypothetical protein